MKSHFQKRRLGWKVSGLVLVLSSATLIATAGQAQAATLMARLAQSIDTEIAMILVPVAALLLFMVAEVVRLILGGHDFTETRKPARVLDWTPGRGEG